MGAPTVMVLCGRSPRHLWVANELCRAGTPVAIVQETGREWSARKLVKLLVPSIALPKAWRWLRDRWRYVGGAEARFFFGEKTPSLVRADLLHEVAHINEANVVRLARTLSPDVIAVFGTSLIRGDLLKEGRLGMINLHGGLSPEYRGADCTFWALYNNEPEKIGCTLHFIDAGIDTGRLIAHVSPAIDGNEDELLLFWRAVRDSAAVYVEAIRRLARGDAIGVTQPSRGTLYQMRQRGLRHELRVARALRKGLLRDKRLGRRVIWFTPDGAQTVEAQP